MKKIIKIFLIIILFSIIFYSRTIEPDRLVIKQQTIYVPNWNKKLDGLKIALISDIHAYYGKISQEKLDVIINKTNEQSPDLIFILGDLDTLYLKKSLQYQEKAGNSLQKLKAQDGVIAILGNHDYEPEGIIKNIYKNAGIPLLENNHKYINHNGQQLRITGLKDLWHCKTSADTIKNLLGNSNIPTIVLSHNPDVFPNIPQNVSLTVSGHTHGGEVYLPVIGAPMVPSNYHQRFRKGYIIENNKHLFVTSGIGTLSGFRFLNPPEIVILEIYSQTPQTKTTDTKPLKGFHKNYIPLYVKIKKQLKH